MTMMGSWEDLDELLKIKPYWRFSLSASRDGNDGSVRKWEAVIFTESGAVVCRGKEKTRDSALAAALSEIRKRISANKQD